jgi:NYN domain
VRTNVYIDGFNLFYGCLKGSPYKWLDIEQLCRRLLPKDHINRIRYFSALVAACAGDPQQPVRQQAYLRAIESLPLVSIHLGEFYISRVRMPLATPPPTGPTTVEVIKTEEKGSDVALATYLVHDACRGDCQTSVVITNDSDLREPLRTVKDELHRATGIINPHPPHKRSRALTATFFKQLRPSLLSQCQLPARLTGSQGLVVHRPATW